MMKLFSDHWDTPHRPVLFVQNILRRSKRYKFYIDLKLTLFIRGRGGDRPARFQNTSHKEKLSLKKVKIS